jgi:DNA mismatch endonuclease (patch repair protein)
MADTLTTVERSERMSRVRNKDTKLELKVRSIVHRMGYRYRLHRRDLPGHPDLAFGPKRKVIFVHGCFWHRHKACKLARLPKSRLDFWKPKLEKNRQRDEKVQQGLRSQGWKYLVIWECEAEDENHVREKVGEYLA